MLSTEWPLDKAIKVARKKETASPLSSVPLRPLGAEYGAGRPHFYEGY